MTDFGIAKDLTRRADGARANPAGRRLHGPRADRGTPDVSHKTDLYSLGIVIYQI